MRTVYVRDYAKCPKCKDDKMLVYQSYYKEGVTVNGKFVPAAVLNSGKENGEKSIYRHFPANMCASCCNPDCDFDVSVEKDPLPAMENFAKRWNSDGVNARIKSSQIGKKRKTDLKKGDD